MRQDWTVFLKDYNGKEKYVSVPQGFMPRYVGTIQPGDIVCTYNTPWHPVPESHIGSKVPTEIPRIFAVAFPAPKPFFV